MRVRTLLILTCIATVAGCGGDDNERAQRPQAPVKLNVNGARSPDEAERQAKGENIIESLQAAAKAQSAESAREISDAAAAAAADRGPAGANTEGGTLMRPVVAAALPWHRLGRRRSDQEPVVMGFSWNAEARCPGRTSARASTGCGGKLPTGFGSRDCLASCGWP